MATKKYENEQEKWRFWYLNNKDKAKVNQQKYRDTHRELVRKRERKYKDSFNGRLRGLLASSKKYAKERDQEFSITYEDLNELWLKQDGKCAITDLPMELSAGSRQNKNYYRISIDRIDNSIGYTKENIHLVCFAVNQMKSDLTMDEFKFWIKTISSQAFNEEGSTTIPQGSTLKRVEVPSSLLNKDDDIVSTA